jgi:ribulose 1,5-bisphosphate carboxylase large subunit-like protein
VERLKLSPLSVLRADHAIVSLRIGFRSDSDHSFHDNIVTLVNHLSGRLPSEVHQGARRDDYAVSVVAVHEDGDDDSNTNCGTVDLAIPGRAFPPEHGFPLLIAIAAFGSVYSNVVEYHLLDIELPELHLASFKGPFHGGNGIATRLDDQRVSFGVVLRPRFHSSPELLTRYVHDFVAAGIDYIVDDELTTPEPVKAFDERITTIRNAIDRGMLARQKHHRDAHKPIFIATVTSRTTLAIQLAEQAVKAGADGVMVNPIVMGFDVLQSLASDADFKGLVIANMIGRSLLTGGPNFRFSPVLLCKLTRLAGADAMYIQPFAGQIRNPRKSAAEYEAALNHPLSATGNHRPSAAIMSGGMGFAELAENERIYEGPLMLSIGERCALAWDRGVSANTIMECLRSIRSALVSDDRETLEHALVKLQSQSNQHRNCLDVFGADALVS